MRRLALTVAVVWACSCGLRGRVPWWVAVQIASGARPDQCQAYRDAYNAYQQNHHGVARIHWSESRPKDSEGLIRWCVFDYVRLDSGLEGCYRFAVDTGLYVWSKTKWVDCRRPWAALAEQHLAPLTA